ncbi:MAG: hypothetical protein JWL77_5839 [Chthonomonadaceae bacterium]|nr:hypothetical protein [Chthonomonadaceae bacterium]
MLLSRGVWAADSDPIFIIQSPKHACVNAPVTIPVPKAFAAKALAASGRVWELEYDGPVSGEVAPIPCQFLSGRGQTTLSFILPRIDQGQTQPFHLHSVPVKQSGSPAAKPGVNVAQTGTDITIDVAGKLFTRYTTHSGPNKPFFYPILTPDNQNLTRRWPVEPNADPAESHDHPHHRGLWFTHSSVNGVDFWTEVETDKVKLGKTVNTGFSNLVSGPVFGEFQATTDWIMPDGKRVATDTRTVHVYPLSDGGRILDFDITFKPDGGPVVFGDNKDGVFGLRLPDSMAVNPSVKPARPGTGHYINSAGDKDGEAWGKAAEWVDYWGPVGSETWGVAMFDSPQNFRHPQTWHARDYALFTVNPFGLHDFKLGPKDAGNYTVAADGSLTLHYRLLFHKGDHTAAHIADQYAAYSAPPTVEAHWDGKKP